MCIQVICLNPAPPCCQPASGRSIIRTVSATALSSRNHPPSCPQPIPRPVSAFCRQPDGDDKLPVPQCVRDDPHMQEAHYMHNAMPPEQPHIVEQRDEHQHLSAGQAVPMTHFAASQGNSHGDHQAPPGRQNLQLLSCSEGQLQAEEEEGMWVEDDYLNCHPGMLKVHFPSTIASGHQTCTVQLNLSV